MTKFSISCFLLVISTLQEPQLCNGFLPATPPTASTVKPGSVGFTCSSIVRSSSSTDDDASASVVEDEEEPKYVEAVPMLSSVTDPKAVQLRDDLLKLAETTQKGFKSTPSEKKKAREIIAELAKFNPTSDPAAPYYSTESNDTGDIEEGSEDTTSSSSSVSLAGKWVLVYTDAPDITSLDSSSWNPLATVALGRIGQECSPPYIKNVIEWKKPDWIDQVPLPFAGGKESRILQKVVTKASATPTKPMLVNLEVAGFELVAPPITTASGSSSSLQESIEQEGLPVGLLRNNPLELRGPLSAPFGQFEILYLDEEMRIIRTNQNYLAVNLRCQGEEWF